MKKITSTHKKGFTLIELLVVIAIIGLLSSIVLASLSSARTKAKNAAYLTEVKQLVTALKMYKLDHGDYPTINSTTNNYQYGAGYWQPSLVTALVDGGYISSLPTHPDQDGQDLSTAIYLKFDGLNAYHSCGTSIDFDEKITNSDHEGIIFTDTGDLPGYPQQSHTVCLEFVPGSPFCGGEMLGSCIPF